MPNRWYILACLVCLCAIKTPCLAIERDTGSRAINQTDAAEVLDMSQSLAGIGVNAVQIEIEGNHIAAGILGTDVAQAGNCEAVALRLNNGVANSRWHIIILQADRATLIGLGGVKHDVSPKVDRVVCHGCLLRLAPFPRPAIRSPDGYIFGAARLKCKSKVADFGTCVSADKSRGYVRVGYAVIGVIS